MTGLVEMDQGGKTGRYADQIMFEFPDGTERAWRVPEDVRSPEQLLHAVRSAGFKGSKPVRFIGDIEGGLERLIRATWPEGTLASLPPIEPAHIKIALCSEVDENTARAIAMLAFHFFLTFYLDRGGEDEFAAIRAVILGKMKPMSLVSMQDPVEATQVIHDVRDERPGVPKHLFIVTVNPRRELVVDFRLFAHTARSPWWRVILTSGASIESKSLGVALVYHIDPTSSLDGELVGLVNDGSTVVVPSTATTPAT